MGEIIEPPNYKILNPYWVDALDNLGSISWPFHPPPYIEIKRLKKVEKKPLTEEEKRERKESAVLYFEKERKNFESWKKRVKLIEVLKKSEMKK